MSWFEKVVRRCRRKPALASALGGLVLAFALGFSGTAWEWRQSLKASRREELQRHRAEAKTLTEERARGEAEKQRIEAQRQLYISDVLLAQESLAESNLGQPRELINRHFPKSGEPDFRGWEWRYLWKQWQTDELYTLAGHGNAVHHVAFSPDGLLLASASTDNTYRLWNLTSMTEIGAHQHENDSDSGIVCSQDGTKLFTT